MKRVGKFWLALAGAIIGFWEIAKFVWYVLLFTAIGMFIVGLGYGIVHLFNLINFVKVFAWLYSICVILSSALMVHYHWMYLLGACYTLIAWLGIRYGLAGEAWEGDGFEWFVSLLLSFSISAILLEVTALIFIK